LRFSEINTRVIGISIRGTNVLVARNSQLRFLSSFNAFCTPGINASTSTCQPFPADFPGWK